MTDERQAGQRQGQPRVKPQEQLDGALYGLVAIGASAGGIEALTTVLGALPAAFSVPLVIAQHLDPTRPSHLDAILARHTSLAVRLVTGVTKLEPGTVYVVPSNRDVEIDDNEVRVRPGGDSAQPSVNWMLSSAARVYGERLIAVILTGTGSDGAAGAREVKVAGGMVIIEDPATAAFPGMPRSLAPTTVDIVARLDQIGPLLRDLVAGTYTPTPPEADLPAGLRDLATEAELQDDALAPLLAHLRERRGIDFVGYRRPTILRRLQRRMAATKSASLDDYRRYLARHPDEYQHLVSSFLIKVTEFFRDPELFRVLRERVLPDVIAQARTRGNELRLWSAGCATGEEAYSLAILVAEALGPELSQFTVRLFATDLDERAVAFARQGVYPAAAVAGVSEELRSRYFNQLDGMYEVKKAIRALVTFGEHDLGQRPPFPRIDLVLCRNVLIYFTPELQRRALALFAYALRPGGYLALGKAESAGALADYLAPADAHYKLYRRVGETLPPPLLPRVTDSFLPPPPPPLPQHHQRAAVGANADPAESGRGDVWLTGEESGRLLLDLPVGVVIVDQRYHIQHINAVALRVLDIYRPAIGEDLVHLAERVPAQALRRIIEAVFHAGPAAEGAAADAGAGAGGGSAPSAAPEVLTLETGLGERRDVEIAAYPYPPRRGSASGHSMAERTGLVETALLLVTDVTSAVQARVAAELAAARDQREPQRALARSGEELEQLRAQVDQVTAINRQLVSANQELGAVNLRLQGANDELVLAHEQEQASAEEIRTLNEELQASNEEMETVNEELEATVEELQASNSELEARGKEMREMADAAERQHQVSAAEAARLAAILRSMGDAVLVVNPNGEPLLTNETYARMFGSASIPFAAQDVEGHPLAPRATPQQRVARGETFVMEFTLDGEDGARRYFEASGQPIRSLGEALGGVISVRDITERSLHRFQDEFLALASHELNTPLTPLYAYLQMLDKLFTDESKNNAENAENARNTRARGYIAHSQDQVRRLRRLVQDLIDVRRLQRGGFNLETERVPLAEVVTRSVEAARLVAPDGQAIALDIARTAPLVVNADAMRLEQVLMNLLSNSITYAPHSTRITVRLWREGNEAVIQVQDEGPGIAAANLPQVFDRFYQITSNDERPARRGLGLGLYIAHELVEAHGGRLEVASVVAPAEGHGATFTIRLPLVPEEAAEGQSERRSQEPPRNGPKERRHGK